MSDADSLQFVDTNVLIYAHDRSAGPKHERSKQLLRELWENRKGCLSIQVLQEFYVKVTQKVPEPLAPEIAAELIADLSTWQVHQPGANDVLEAIAIQSRQQLAFWDAMIIASAMSLGCEILWSEDLNPGQSYPTVMVRNPFA
ncbi:MAG: twitching motility protein PilT [Chloroflexi bacterium RBG_16_57_11]|nr:MAG: twitching motility protein PilT [Chloroflexi bacterium RBG_16_57_11]